MAALVLSVDKEGNSVQQGQSYPRARQGEQWRATRTEIDFSSTVSPLRGASILVSINRANFQLQKELLF